MQAIQLGLDTVGDVTSTADGKALSPAETLRAIVKEAVLADEVGVDVFGIGEQHRAVYAVSAPDTVLAAIGASTKQIHDYSEVIDLSTAHQVRVSVRIALLQ